MLIQNINDSNCKVLCTHAPKYGRLEVRIG